MKNYYNDHYFEMLQKRNDSCLEQKMNIFHGNLKLENLNIVLFSIFYLIHKLF